MKGVTDKKSPSYIYNQVVFNANARGKYIPAQKIEGIQNQKAVQQSPISKEKTKIGHPQVERYTMWQL